MQVELKQGYLKITYIQCYLQISALSNNPHLFNSISPPLQIYCPHSYFLIFIIHLYIQDKMFDHQIRKTGSGEERTLIIGSVIFIKREYFKAHLYVIDTQVLTINIYNTYIQNFAKKIEIDTFINHIPIIGKSHQAILISGSFESFRRPRKRRYGLLGTGSASSGAARHVWHRSIFH